MGIEADKESIGSIVWVDRCKFAQDRANEGDHNTSDIGVLWAEDHIVTQAAAIEALRAALIGIATQGCEMNFGDDHEMCSTLSGYSHDEWCNPCLANEALMEKQE